MNNKIIRNNETFFKGLDVDIFILGTNKYGLSLAKWLIERNYKFRGFINDYVNDIEFEGYKIYKSTYNFQNSHIINCIIEGRIIDAEHNINSLKPKSHNHYFDFQNKFPDQLLDIDYLENEHLLKSKDIEEIKKVLYDNRSKEEFISVLSFRKKRDINHLSGFKFRINEQYFEDFITFDSYPVFIDGGGYDGATSLRFAELYPQYRRIYYFEPSDVWFKNSKENLSKLKNIEFFNCGLWNKDSQLKFNNTLGSASKLDNEGNTFITVTSIDKVIKEKVDYIKLDVEGAEYDTILGARNTIKKYKPKLAICVYHNSLDFIRIPRILLRFNPDYKIYFRHYTQGLFESIMYFV